MEDQDLTIGFSRLQEIEAHADSVCRDFERIWQSGGRPRLSEFVNGNSSPILFRKLLKIDIGYRRVQGEQPSSQEYSSQFPDYREIVDEVVSQDEHATGRMVGEYRLLEKIGQGGMGVVYRAIHQKLNRVVALKLLTAARSADPWSQNRFRKEMAAVGKLDHPNVVRAYDAGEHDGAVFLAMEFIEGTDLAAILSTQGKMNFGDACEAIRQATAGVDHAWAHGLVHRDLKPSNILVSTSGTAKVVDLGLAQVRGEVDGHTSSGNVFGTYDYMSPEQAREVRDVDVRSDIYSLGCTLYQLLTGQVPYPKPKYHSVTQKLLAHASDPVPLVSDLRSDVPAAVSQLVARAMAKSPGKRFQTAGDLIQALEPFCASSELGSLVYGRDMPHPAETVVRPRDSTRPNTYSTVLSQALQRWTKPGRLAIAGGIVVAMLLLAAVINGSFSFAGPGDADLAEITPIKIEYPGYKAETGSCVFDEEMGAWLTKSDRPHFIQLGELDAAATCTLSATLQRRPWLQPGFLGFFFGYREVPSAKWDAVAEVNLLQLEAHRDGTRFVFFPGPQIDPLTGSYGGYRKATVLQKRPHRDHKPRLTVKLVEGKIDEITFGEDNLSEYVDVLNEALRADDVELDMSGPWGIYINGGTFWFSNVDIRN